MTKTRTPHAVLTFSERHGYDPLPRVLRLEEVPDEARIQMWNVIYRHAKLDSTDIVATLHGVGKPWRSIFQAVHDQVLGRPLSDLKVGSVESFDKQYQTIFREIAFNRLFDVLQVIMRHPDCPKALTKDLSDCFCRNGLAYFVKRSGVPTICPATIPEEAAATERSLVALENARFAPASRHFRQATSCLNDGDYAGCVRESIHAVESVARRLDSEASKSLGPALKSLKQKTDLHPALEGAFSKLYGYSADEEGVRHSLVLMEAPQVSADEAVFMFSACAAFCGYLSRKYHAANGDDAPLD